MCSLPAVRVGQAQRIIRETEQNAGKVVFFPSDLRNREDVKKLVPTAVATFGRLDFAFNNAGVSGPTALLTEQTEPSFDLLYVVNVKALFLMLQDELRQMVAQESGGSIVNTSSVNGILATPGLHWISSVLCTRSLESVHRRKSRKVSSGFFRIVRLISPASRLSLTAVLRCSVPVQPH